MNDTSETSLSARRVRRELDFGEPLSYTELSSRLNLTERHLRRALDELRSQGVEIVTEGKPLRFSIPERYRRQNIRTIPLSEEEIIALRLAAQASRAALAPTPLVDALDSAFSRLLDEASTRTISFDEESVRRAWYFTEPPHSAIAPDVFDVLRDAIDARQTVLIDYVTASTGTAWNGRRVDPYCIAMRLGTWMLVAWCHKRGEVREFNLAGISHAVPCDPASDPHAIFEMPDDFDPDLYFRDRFRYLGGGDVHVVRLLVEPAAAVYFQRKCYHPTQQIEERHDDGRIVVSYEVEGLEEIRSFAQSWGIGVTVLGPEELVERMRGDAWAVAERYGR